MKTHVRYDGKNYQVATLSNDELLDLKVALNTEIAVIKMQLDTAKTQRLVNGEFADPAWWRSASNAKTIKTMDVQAVDRELSKRKKERKEQSQAEEDLKQRNLERQFFLVCKMYLPKDDFRRLLVVAQEQLFKVGAGEP